MGFWWILDPRDFFPFSFSPRFFVLALLWTPLCHQILRCTEV
jgi:hypothetical protein